MTQTRSDPFWTQSPEILAQVLHCGLRGLGEAEAGDRLRRYGPNVDQAPRREGLLRAVGRRLLEPLSLVLIAAALLSGASRDPASASMILLMLLLSIGLDMIQEGRARRAADALRRSVAVKIRVTRGAIVRWIEAEELVPGDLIHLSPGDVVPADALILKCSGCTVDEASLTGEPYPVRKRTGAVATRGPADAINALLRGSVVQAGEADALVVATGAATLFGSAASVLAERDVPSPFQRDLRALGFLVVRITGVLVLVVLAAHVMFGRPVLESLMFATALAVGLTPELLPMITTVTLSRGAVRLARRKVIVKRLSAIHDLGAMTVLCTDKTGTLTSAHITLDRTLGLSGAPEPEALRLAALAARLAGDSSAIDAALTEAAAEEAGWCAEDHAAFDFNRRLGWALIRRGADRRMVVKGAPEAVIAACAFGDGSGGLTPLTEADRKGVLSQVERLAAEGLRTIAVASRTAEDSASVEGLTWLGLCAFADPPKPSAAAAVRRLREAGVMVRILSGDHPEAVGHLARIVGLEGRVMTGEEIAGLNPGALRARVRTAAAFARLTPDQKARVVRALQQTGATVGFLGDGVNDAPGIKSADIGLSVEGATGVAREAADMILLDPGLEVVADGVEEGRRTFLNILKYVRMGASSNFGNMLSMAAASLFLPFLPMLPIQILLNNLLYDGSEVGIPMDQVSSEEVARPQIWSLPKLLHFTLVMGALSSVFDLATFWVLGWRAPASEAAFRTGWFMESMASQILVIFIIRTPARPWTSRPHWALALSSLSALALALALPFSPWAEQLGFKAPSPRTLATLLALVLAYLTSAEIAKGWVEGPGPRFLIPLMAHRRDRIRLRSSHREARHDLQDLAGPR